APNAAGPAHPPTLLTASTSAAHPRPSALVDHLASRRVQVDRVRDRVGVQVQGVGTEVVDGVAVRVVAGVERLSGGATPLGGLLRSLDDLGAGEQATGRHAVVDERLVVGTAVERLRFGRLS